MGSLFVSGAGYQCAALADNDTAHKGKRGRSESLFLSYLFIFNFSFVCGLFLDFFHLTNLLK